MELLEQRHAESEELAGDRNWDLSDHEKVATSPLAECSFEKARKAFFGTSDMMRRQDG
jgi:hypothetical protein